MPGLATAEKYLNGNGDALGAALEEALMIVAVKAGEGERGERGLVLNRLPRVLAAAEGGISRIAEPLDVSRS